MIPFPLPFSTTYQEEQPSQFLELSDWLPKNLSNTKWFACETDEQLLITFQHKVILESV